MERRSHGSAPRSYWLLACCTIKGPSLKCVIKKETEEDRILSFLCKAVLTACGLVSEILVS